jgi:selenocysteine-specific elongation factor
LEQHTLTRLEDGVYLADIALKNAVAKVKQALHQNPEGLSTAELRNVLDTNRRFAVLILEWLDSQRITRRIGDKRVLQG